MKRIQGSKEIRIEREFEWEIMKEDRMVLDAALEAGCILLKNGAEIFRVEETMYRICRYYGIHSCNVFTLTNGIFLTAGDDHEPYFAKVKHLPVGGANLGRVAAVNQLSREIEQGNYTIEEVIQKLEEIKRSEEKSNVSKLLAAGIGCSAFCILFQGTLFDCITAFCSGISYYIFKLYIEKGTLSKITSNLCGGILITMVCLLSYQLHFGEHLYGMVAGSIMPLVPGVPFTNSIRDFADGDYISGAVRMLDAILVFFSIAIGMGFVFLLYHHIMGGAIL